jgi:hypothetical protein
VVFSGQNQKIADNYFHDQLCDLSRRNHMTPYRIAALESLAASLTDSAYQVILQHGVQGSFVDLELKLWNNLRAKVYRELVHDVSTLEPCQA